METALLLLAVFAVIKTFITANLFVVTWEKVAWGVARATFAPAGRLPARGTSLPPRGTK